MTQLEGKKRKTKEYFLVFSMYKMESLTFSKRITMNMNEGKSDIGKVKSEKKYILWPQSKKLFQKVIKELKTLFTKEDMNKGIMWTLKTRQKVC